MINTTSPIYIFLCGLLLSIPLSAKATDQHASAIKRYLTASFTVLDNVTVAATTSSHVLTWKTVTDFVGRGFNVYRMEKDGNGKFINRLQLNTELLPIQPQNTFETIPPSMEAVYVYELETIDDTGNPTLHSELRVTSKPNHNIPMSCRLYGVHKQSVNRSVFFEYNPLTNQPLQIGDSCTGCDIKDMGAHPLTNELFVVSGDMAQMYPSGYLYRFDVTTGKLLPIGETGFTSLNSIAFDSTGQLWGWARDIGLVQLNTDTGEGTLILASELELTDLAWSLDDDLLYGAVGDSLWSYLPQQNSLKQLCDQLPTPIKAVQVFPENIWARGVVLLGNELTSTGSLYAFNVNRCEKVLNIKIRLLSGELQGLTVPMASCALSSYQ